MGTPRSPDLPTFGPRVGQLAALCGVPMMPWQQHVLEVALERRGDRWRYSRVIVHVQRRAGKSTMTFMRQTHRAVTRPSSAIWYGAQSRKDGVEIWDQQLNEHLIPQKDRLKFKPRASVGSESLRFANGSRVSLFTPAESALVGLATDDVTVDEARFHSVARGLALEAGIRPTQATRDGQLWVVSSAGTFGQSDWLWSWLTKGRESLADPDSPIAFFDYSIPDDGDPLDLDLVTAHHPAAGYTITREFLAAERDSMDPYDFAREYAGQWTKAVEQKIPPHDWHACADTRRPQPSPGNLVLGFATNPSSSLGAVTAAWRDPAGRKYVAILDQRPGIEWMETRIAELHAKWQPAWVVYNKIGPAVALADRLGLAGMKLIPVGFADYVVACQSFLDQVKHRDLFHHAQPDLDDAVAVAAARTIRSGDGFVWGHQASSGPIVSLEAATLAGWGYDHRPPKRPRGIITPN